jgi:hypothetical protein
MMGLSRESWVNVSGGEPHPLPVEVADATTLGGTYC